VRERHCVGAAQLARHEWTHFKGCDEGRVHECECSDNVPNGHEVALGAEEASLGVFIALLLLKYPCSRLADFLRPSGLERMLRHLLARVDK
jgi:hypothetical protein